MAEVSVTISGRSYDIACDDGQEGRIVDLAGYIDQRLVQIARSGGAYNDAHLMVLTALVLADEVFEARAEADRTRQEAARSKAPQPRTQKSPDEKAMLSVLDQITKRIESIAERVEAA